MVSLIVPSCSHFVFFDHMITPLLNYGCATNYLSRWLGLNEDQCALDEASLGVEATKPLSHLVNTC